MCHTGGMSKSAPTPAVDASSPVSDDRVSMRRQEIMEIAAQLFAQKGYRGTSMRDIGVKAGVLGGSLYHHIKSKDALFVKLHDAALDGAEQRIRDAVNRKTDPWERLEAACITLLEVQLAQDSLTLPMMNHFRDVPPDVRQQLISRRDAFEDVFRKLVVDLPLPADIDRSIYRNLLLSQLNTAAEWFRPGRLDAAQIARQIVRIFRH